jgi:hypothetical protein
MTRDRAPAPISSVQDVNDFKGPDCEPRGEQLLDELSARSKRSLYDCSWREAAVHRQRAPYVLQLIVHFDAIHHRREIGLSDRDRRGSYIVPHRLPETINSLSVERPSLGSDLDAAFQLLVDFTGGGGSGPQRHGTAAAARDTRQQDRPRHHARRRPPCGSRVSEPAAQGILAAQNPKAPVLRGILTEA